MTNAARHRKRRHVLNVDLADFFPSINFGRVRGVLIKDNRLKLHPKIATIIAQIACHNGALPQGSPCSPVLSNIVAGILDRRLAHLAARLGCRYTRYADDITFSTNQSDFPTELAVENAAGTWVAGPQLTAVIQHSGFAINNTKTRMQFKRSRQVVTGLVTNTKISVPKENRKNVRAMVNRLLTQGRFYIPTGGVLSTAATGADSKIGTLPQLNGALGHIGAVEYFSKHQTAKLHANIAHSGKSSTDDLYRRFLFYTEFYAASMPVVLCEGKTDNVYLKSALENLNADFPALVENGTPQIRFFKYERINTARRLGFVGGAGFLSTFISNYAKEVIRIAAPGMAKPVVIIVDHDSAAAPVVNAAKQASKNFKISLDWPYSRIIGNLYLMAIPGIAGQKSTVIEDLFPVQLRTVQVGGKTFNATKTFNPAVNYGKQVFAEKVVKPHTATIDFSGFKPLLTNLSHLISTYKAP
jgi:hypothetical protein